jgi:hypothetical protein
MKMVTSFEKSLINSYFKNLIFLYFYFLDNNVNFNNSIKKK